MPVSCCKISCVLRAILAEKSVGRLIASSNEFVCRDCVPPKVAAIASIVVRIILLYGSCSARLAPEVWQCVRNIKERSSLGLKSFSIQRAHNVRAARNLAASMKKFIPIQKKKDRRGANLSTSSPFSAAALTYSRPSARVKASSCTRFAPASCM